ncbi:MAG: hypothetical protein L0387_38655 [Acidobacteria bacterium]|nr:hypothetical protein [Acidobacteriota bacterium]MCI0721671.1 hypothetical protein [Acidobacteriota bacterium]
MNTTPPHVNNDAIGANSLGHRPTKQEVYDIAAAIERESDNRLIAVPCEGGKGIAVSNGGGIWFVEATQVSTPEAIHARVSRWLNTNSAPALEPTEDEPPHGVVERLTPAERRKALERAKQAL